MYTYVSVVFLAESIAPEVPKLIKKTRCHRDYRMSLYGWMDYRIAAYDCYFEKDLHKLGGTTAKADPPLCHEKKEETQMNAVVLLVVGVAILVAGYIFYGGWLAKQCGTW